MGDGVTFRRRVRYDAPFTGDPRIAYELKNVWLEVPWGDDGRADALFHFSVMLRKSELEDDDTLRDGDYYWCCERMSTEPLDEDTAQRRREQREER